jgi:hypothetical protein
MGVGGRLGGVSSRREIDDRCSCCATASSSLNLPSFFSNICRVLSEAQQLTAVRCACACGVCGVQDKAVLYGISSYNINKDTYL